MLKRSRSDKKASPWGAGQGLLLVCDDPDAGELLTRLLRQTEHDVDRVETAEGAMRNLLAAPRWAMVLALSGAGANRRLLEKVRDHPKASVAQVAAVVLADDLADGAKAWGAGADGFLARPFHAAHLLEEVRAAAERPLDDRAAHRQARLDAG